MPCFYIGLRYTEGVLCRPSACEAFLLRCIYRHAKQGLLFLLRSHLCLLCFIAMRSKACEASVAKKQKHGGKCKRSKKSKPCFAWR
jgi:hypothetical protein